MSVCRAALGCFVADARRNDGVCVGRCERALAVLQRAQAGAAPLVSLTKLAFVGADEGGLGFAPLGDEPGWRMGGTARAPGGPAEAGKDGGRGLAGGVLARVWVAGAQAAAPVAVCAALGEQAPGGSRGEAVQPAFGAPVAGLGLDVERAGVGAARAAVPGAASLAPGFHVAMEGRLAEQPAGVGAVFAERVLDDLEAEAALALLRLDVGLGRGFRRPRAARVGGGVDQAMIEPPQGEAGRKRSIGVPSCWLGLAGGGLCTGMGR